MAQFRSTAFLLTLLLLAGCASDPNRDVALSHEGQEAMLAGDLKTAESRLTEALDANPDNPHALTTLSTIYIKQARYDEARPLCQRVISHEDAYLSAAASDDETKEVERLVQVARDNLATVQKEQAEEQSLLALTPDGAPAAAPLVREPAATTVPATTTASAAATTPETPAPAVESAPAAAPTTTATATTPTAAPQPATPPAVAAAPAPFHYRIQVGAFKSRANAERMAKRLRERHADAMQEKEVRFAEGGGMVKVQVGPYDSLKQASEACRPFAQAGLRCFPKGHD